MNSKPAISIIVAAAADGAIGRNGGIPFRIRQDMIRFRTLTMGHPLVMGRRTYESLPGGALPGRRNIIVSRSGFTASDAETVSSVDSALSMMSGEVMIIGGGEIYRQLMPLADTLYLTEIDAVYQDADTHIDLSELSEPESGWVLRGVTPWREDEPSGLRYRFMTYRRDKNRMV